MGNFNSFPFSLRKSQACVLKFMNKKKSDKNNINFHEEFYRESIMCR